MKTMIISFVAFFLGISLSKAQNTEKKAELKPESALRGMLSQNKSNFSVSPDTLKRQDFNWMIAPQDSSRSSNTIPIPNAFSKRMLVSTKDDSVILEKKLDVNSSVKMPVRR